ncbi:MAG: hypothetical protein ACYTA5_21750 [Planctomycetota bacterium]
MTISKLPDNLADIEEDVWEYIFSVRDQVRAKYGYDSDDELTLPQVSAIIYTARCYLRERILEQQHISLLAYNKEVPKNLLEEIRKASCTRHGALLKLGISEKETGADLPDFTDDEE